MLKQLKEGKEIQVNNLTLSIREKDGITIEENKECTFIWTETLSLKNIISTIASNNYITDSNKLEIIKVLTR